VSITQENAKIETGVTTATGNPLLIAFDPHGYYKIEVEGSGAKPAICDELFTSIRFAKLAVAKYKEDNQAELSKLALKEKHGGPKRK
jgi:hypothetical protein